MQNPRTFLLIDAGTINHHRCRNVMTLPRPICKEEPGPAMVVEGFSAAPPRPWEPRIDNGYPNVIWDDDAGIFRLYYTTFLVDDDSSSTPLASRAGREYRPSAGRVTGLCYAESQDGKHWVTPDLGLVEFAGSRANNILMVGAHGTGVLLDGAQTGARGQFKAITKVDLVPGRSYMATMVSDDGIHFSRPRQWPRYNPAGDTHNVVMWDPSCARYVVLTRIWRDNLRICALSTSADYVHWTEPTEILRGAGPANQVYSMPVFRWGEHYVGLASIYHDGDRDDEQFDTVDCALTIARSLDSWEFPTGFKPVVPRGSGEYPHGSFDCGCVYASAPVQRDGKLWIYYFGGNGRHTGFRETRLARGWWEPDKFGFVAARVTWRPSLLALGPLAFEGNCLELLAEIDPGGEIRCEVISATSGEVIDGFDARSVDPIRESGWSRIRFPSASFDHLLRSAVVVLVHFTAARLFAVRGDIDLASRAAPAALPSP